MQEINPITEAKNKIDFTQEAKDYAGNNWHKLTETEKQQIITEIEKNFLKSTHY
jgi:hypothetical protein